MRIRGWWEGADKSQRTVTLVGGGFLLLLIVATYFFASRPHMGLLASNLSPAEQGTAVQELQKMGIPYEMDLQGNINVPTERIAEVRAKLMMGGKLPANARAGADDDLAKLGYVNTPRVERERIKAIAESKLAQDIAYLDGVDSARVHLALGDDSPFVNDRRQASASVTVFEKGGASISKEQARGIAMMVASSIPNLDANEVSVLNRRGEPLLDPDDSASGQGKIGTKLETERMEAKRRERELQAKLDSAFGMGSTNVTVDLTIDFSGAQYTETKRTPSAPLVTTETKEKMSGAGQTPKTQPGAIGAPAGSTPSDQSYTNTSKETTYVTDERTTKGEDPAGNLKSMTIAVLVDSNKKIKTDVDAFIQSYLGAHTTDPNFKATVTETKFDTSAAADAKKAADASASGAKLQQMLSILPIGALILVAVMILRTIAKYGKTETLLVAAPDGRMIPLPSSGINVSADLVGGSGAPVLTVQQGGAAAKAAASTPAGGASALPKPTKEEEDLEIDSIKRKVNVPLEQIKMMSDERPEVVAMLIKSWLMEERR